MPRSVVAKRMLRGAAVAAGLLLATLAGGCGEEDFANRPRPVPTIVVAATISDERVSASPDRVAAGPIDLIVSNQTRASHRVTLRSRATPSGRRTLRQSTGPINPGDTASLAARLDEGSYALTADTGSIDSTTIEVRGRRRGGGDRLLEP